VFESTRRWVTETAAVFGCCIAITTTCMFGGGEVCACACM
jgi:hypothetical protein